MSEFFAANLGAPPKNVLDWSSLIGVSRLTLGKEAVAWSKEEAFLAVLFAAATCDGKLSSEEHEELLALVHRSRVLKVLSTDQLAAINAQSRHVCGTRTRRFATRASRYPRKCVRPLSRMRLTWCSPMVSFPRMRRIS